jgi:hypothetical protein
LSPDHRDAFRIQVDILATAEQIPALKDAIGEALCQGPGDHDGPCRIAWSIVSFGGSHIGLKGSGLSRKEAALIQELLEPVDVWPREAVDESLGLADRQD